MTRTLVSELKHVVKNVKMELIDAEQLLTFCRPLKKGDFIYSEVHQIRVARDGVGDIVNSHKPALLRYKSWGISGDSDLGVVLMCDVIASEDSVPYSSPYQPLYSGKLARIINMWRTTRIVPKEDLMLYISYQHKTKLFEDIIKGV